MTRRQRRLGILLAALVCAGAATALTLNAFRSNLVFFFSPSQIAAKEAPVAQVFRLGGLVERVAAGNASLCKLAPCLSG